MRTWWSCDSLAEILRSEKLALDKEDCRRYKILMFFTQRAFSSFAFRWGYQDKASAAPLNLP